MQDGIRRPGPEGNLRCHRHDRDQGGILEQSQSPTGSSLMAPGTLRDRRGQSETAVKKDNHRKLYESILRIAKKYNWTSGLPKSVKQRMKKGESPIPE